jgi:hypothetical protein
VRIDGSLNISDQDDDRVYTSDQLIAVLESGPGGGRAAQRTTMTASYSTVSVRPTVYYTALNTDGTVLTSRRTSGVSLSASGDYTYSQNVATLTGAREFVAVWDEGDANDYILERVVVDT